MSDKIKANECAYIWTSLSAFCAGNLTDFRNYPMKGKKPENACFTNWTCRIVAEPLYLITGLVAVVEAVVRLPLAMLAALLKMAMCCDFQAKRTNSCLDTMFFGSIACIETAIFSFEALVYNLSCSNARVIKSKEFAFHPVALQTK